MFGHLKKNSCQGESFVVINVLHFVKIVMYNCIYTTASEPFWSKHLI